MRDKALYAKILNISEPWVVTDVDLNKDTKQITVYVDLTNKAVGGCATCGKSCAGYDHRIRRWRHLDTCQYQTVIEAKMLRVECDEHGVSTVPVPWADKGSKLTALFEAVVIDWLKEASISAVATQLKLSWKMVDGIMKRAVERGLMRRKEIEVTKIGVDETSFKKGHDYVSIVTDAERKRILFIADDRKADSLDGFFKCLSIEQLNAIKSISMDMWAPFIKAVRDNIKGSEEKIAFDKFHVAQHLGNAVDKVRKSEHKDLKSHGRDDLVKSKYKWLRNPNNMSAEQWKDFAVLRKSNLKTARAWAIKELAMDLWGYKVRGWAEKGWLAWYGWAIRSKLDPIKRVAKMIKNHLWGIINAIVLNANNGHAESMNSKVQKIKRMACGFRCKERFKNALYFHLGDLELAPATILYWK